MKSTLITLLWIGLVVSTLSDALELSDVLEVYCTQKPYYPIKS